MTKAELQELITSSINNSLKDYSKTTDISSTYATKEDIEDINTNISELSQII